MWGGCRASEEADQPTDNAALAAQEECALDTGPCNTIYEIPEGYPLPAAEIEQLARAYPDQDYYIIVTSESCGGCSTYVGQYLHHKKPQVRVLLLVSETYYQMARYRRMRFGETVHVVQVPDDSLKAFKALPAPVVIQRMEKKDGAEVFKTHFNDNPLLFKTRLNALFASSSSVSP